MCLASVAEHLPELPVYVYENSGEGYPGREELAARYPAVHWVLGPVNIGFAAAVQRAGGAHAERRRSAVAQSRSPAAGTVDPHQRVASPAWSGGGFADGA